MTTPEIQPWRSRLERGALWACVLVGASYAAMGLKPWHTGVARALAKNKPPDLRDALPWGFWWGAVATVLVCAGLALSYHRWRPARPATMPVPRLTERPLRLLGWACLLAVLLAATAAHRWPRLSHSFWGDESLAMAAYVQDHYIASSAERKLGPLKLKKVPWVATWFGDWETGNNHYLFTVLSRASLERWRRWNHRARHEFSETAARVPAFAGGLGLLAAVALVGRRLGAPRAGLLGAALLAVHPWHLRYSTEARGYSLMGMFFCLSLWALIPALETGAWIAWMGFAGLQFLTLYSCKIALYPLVALNIMVAIALWRRPIAGQARPAGLVRWFVPNLLAGLVFLVLYAPCHPQALGGAAKIKQRGQTRFSPEWFLDMSSEAATGMPWRSFIPDSHVQISWMKYWLGRPETGGPLGTVVAVAALVGLLLALGVGMRRLWREARPAAWAVLSCGLGAVLMSLHLRYGLEFEILPWYGFFLAPVLCLLAALGAASPARWRWASMLALPVLLAAALWPLNRVMIQHPFENLRGAMEASRGRHESPYRKSRSRVYTCWLWRSSVLYDPRGNTQIRTLPMLNYAIREAETAKGDLYMIIGYPELARRLTPTVYQRVTSDPSFEKVAEFPAQVPRHTLAVYRYVPESRREAHHTPHASQLMARLSPRKIIQGAGLKSESMR